MFSTNPVQQSTQVKYTSSFKSTVFVIKLRRIIILVFYLPFHVMIFRIVKWILKRFYKDFVRISK